MKQIKLAALVTTTTLVAASAFSQGILLTVDISNPNAVIFTATTNTAAVNNNTSHLKDGVDLSGFFSSFTSFGKTASGTLTVNGSAAAYNDVGVADFVNLNLYTSGNFALQTFSPSNPAFIGALTADLSSIVSRLPAVGTTGNITIGSSTTTGPIIGQWEVITAPVPEPGTMALASISGMGLLLLVRRNK